MPVFLVMLAVGILICVLGIINMTGNISTLHWYHRQRVTAEEVKPFGRLVGLGTLLVGISVLLFGILFWISEALQLAALVVVATILLIVGIVVGMTLSFYAMIKYNKGIF